MFKNAFLLFFIVAAISKCFALIDPSANTPTCKSITSSNLCVQLGSKFYLINNQDKLNWFEAQRYCQRFGGSLVTIENAHEMKLVSDHLASRGYNINWHKGGPGFWTSGFDLGSQPGVFYSITNGDFLPYTAWTHNQPDNAGGKEHCVHIWFLDAFGMNDLGCSNDQQNFICDFKQRLPDETSKTGVCETQI